MKIIKDVRSLFDEFFEPKTKIIEQVEIGDVQSPTIQKIIEDRGYCAPDRTGEIASITKEGE
jgi:hypothetical protein